jgi:protein-disulfide isomerase
LTLSEDLIIQTDFEEIKKNSLCTLLSEVMLKNRPSDKKTYKGKKKGISRKSLVIAVSVIAGIVVSVGIAVAVMGTGKSGDKLTPQSQLSSMSAADLVAQGAPVKGSNSAKVTLIEFGDFQCHFCARFATQTESQIDQQYISNGKVNMIFKHFAWYGPDSVAAAIASQCANDQGKFWEFHNILYQNQGEINTGWASKDNLEKFASQVEGLDRTQFDSCLDSGKYRSYVESDKSLATSLGFEGTPGFIVEKSDGSEPVKITGAYPFATFQQAIDQKLSEK